MPCIHTVPYIPCIHSYIHSYMTCVHTFIAFIHVIHSYLHVMHSFLHAFIHTCIHTYMPRIASYFPCTCIHTHTVMRSYFPYIHSYMHAMHWYMSCIQYSYMPWVHKLTCHVLTTRVERIPLLMLRRTVTTARLVDFQTACDTWSVLDFILSLIVFAGVRQSSGNMRTRVITSQIFVSTEPNSSR